MLKRVRTSLLVGLGYAAISFAYFGWPLLPHPGRDLLGTGRDPEIFVWSFAWWPHAIAAGENPFVTHAVYAPDGVNLAWTTSVPVLALAFSPLTALFGPVASYNVAALLMPALAAWTGYLLCRHVTRSLIPSLVGGYLFGFSSYLIGQQLGHMHMTAVFLVPLVALVVVRHLEGELAERAFAWRLGLLLGLQFWISTEVFVTLNLMLLLALSLALALIPELRQGVRALARSLLGAYVTAMVIAGPLLVYALIGFESESINEPRNFNGDLLNLVVPTRLLGLGGERLAGISAHFPSSDAERGAYLGLPTLAIVALYAVQARPTRGGRFLLASLGLSALLTLGTALTVRGHELVTLPWSWLSRLPALNNVLPVRFALFSSLAAAVVVALWMQTRAGWLRLALPGLAVAALVPAIWHPTFRVDPERHAFFTDGFIQQCIPRNENLAIFPYGSYGDSMLWQAETGFWFRMAGGYLRPRPPAKNLAHPTIRKLIFTLEPPTMPELLSLTRSKRVDRIVSVAAYVYPGDQIHRFGTVQEHDGVLIAPACGNPPLTPQSRLLPKWIYGPDGRGRYASPPGPTKPRR